MKTLYLVRHGKSSWEYPHLDDIERPLAKRGKRDAPIMAGRLVDQGIFPDLMISSPAKRAFKTCKIFAEAMGYPVKEIVVDEEVYHASEDALISVLQNCDDTWKTIMLFGHNPGFTDFANSIANEDIVNIPTSGVFACQVNVDRWEDIRFGMGKKILFDFPKKAAHKRF